MTQKEFKIFHPSGIDISCDLKESAMSAIDNAERKDMGTGYIWYLLPTSEVFGKEVSFNLCFFNGALFTAHFSLHDPKLYGKNWDDWSEEKERLRAKDTAAWLVSQGYKLGSYSWGEIWAGYDPKGATGGGGVNFNH